MATKIDAGICERLVTAATSHCQTVIPNAPAPTIQTVHEPNWEGVTTGLTTLSTVISLALLVLAVISLLGLVRWAIFVRRWAEREARIVAEQIISKWLTDKAGDVVRQHVENIVGPIVQPVELHLPPGPTPADEIGNQAG